MTYQNIMIDRIKKLIRAVNCSEQYCPFEEECNDDENELLKRIRQFKKYDEVNNLWTQFGIIPLSNGKFYLQSDIERVIKDVMNNGRDN